MLYFVSRLGHNALYGNKNVTKTEDGTGSRTMFGEHMTALREMLERLWGLGPEKWFNTVKGLHGSSWQCVPFAFSSIFLIKLRPIFQWMALPTVDQAFLP